MGLLANFFALLRRLCGALLANVTKFYGSSDTVPQEADNQDALKEPGFAERPDIEEDAPPVEPSSDREDSISSSGDGRSEFDSPPCLFDCLDVGCTWPCTHHYHWWDGDKDFKWYPDLEYFVRKHPEIPRDQTEMKIGVKDCQFCRIFFTIGQSGCGRGCGDARNDQIPKSSGCGCKSAKCSLYDSNGQVCIVYMRWTCGQENFYELGLPTAPDPRVFPYIAPCMGTLHCDPGSDESLALMKGWIDDCQRRHQICMKTPQQAHGPGRLLHCLSDGSVRLETQSPTQRRNYMVLSYCWGNEGTAVKKTKQATVGMHHRGMPHETLPPLYREAAALARGLKIPYLWIDSLCIIQDSDSDKEEEIGRMSDIYRGALVVIIAGSAQSPQDSLLSVKSQSGPSHTWRTASLIRYEEMDLDVKFRERAEVPHHCNNATRDTPTGERAWCFQEKLLANRCLVFLHDEVVWECQSCCQCECSGKQEHFSVGGIMEPYHQMVLPLAQNEPFQLDGTLRYFGDDEDAYLFWEAAVNNYSNRRLSYQTDRLPAISAIASIFAESTGDRYLAGLWRGNLIAGLSWQVRFCPEDDPKPHQEYIAPTWSWASLPRGATYDPDRTQDSGDGNFDALVVDAWTAKKGQNPYGQVSDAAIVLSGLHCDAELTIPEREPGCIWNAQLDFGHGDVQTVYLQLLGALDYTPVGPDTYVDQVGRKSRYLRPIKDRQTDEQPACSGTVRLLWLGKGISLILTPSRRRKWRNGAYERLGIFYGRDAPTMPKRVQRSSVTLV